MHFFTAQIAHPNGETTRRQVTADDIAEARTKAYQVADSLGREWTSVEVWH